MGGGFGKDGEREKPTAFMNSKDSARMISIWDAVASHPEAYAVAQDLSTATGIKEEETHITESGS